MKTKNYLLINAKVIKVGVEMNRVFDTLAGQRAPWFSIIHQDEVNAITDIVRVHLEYAYYDVEGKLDLAPSGKVMAQKLGEWFEQRQPHEKQESKQVIPMRYALKKPKLTSEELMALQTRVSKDLGIAVNINQLLNTVG
jgi:hypothetical protein